MSRSVSNAEKRNATNLNEKLADQGIITRFVVMFVLGVVLFFLGRSRNNIPMNFKLACIDNDLNLKLLRVFYKQDTTKVSC